MTEALIRYIKIAIGFAVAWILLYVWTSCGYQRIAGAEMAPALPPNENHVIMIKERSPDVLAPGDIVAFEYQLPQLKPPFAGRVMAFPGQRVKMSKGELYVNERKGDTGGTPLGKPEDDFEEIIVPRDCYFIVMDNRTVGPKLDSRAIGPLGVGAVLGKVRK
ncbi:MAG TPA: signal peptidase I [Planctomycetota bacterium]|jgi:signal peptidase I